MWERGEKLLSRQPSSMMRCPCGEVTAMTRPEAIPIANTSTPSTKPVKHTEARPFTDPGTIRLPLGVDVQDDPRDLAPVGAACDHLTRLSLSVARPGPYAFSASVSVVRARIAR